MSVVGRLVRPDAQLGRDSRPATQTVFFRSPLPPYERSFLELPVLRDDGEDDGEDEDAEDASAEAEGKEQSHRK